MSDMDEFLEMFFAECDELLEAVAAGLRQMDEGNYEMETVHAVFRAVHSIKGGAAAFGLSDLVAFAHKFETALDLLRADALEATPQVMSVFHRSSDCLADLVVSSRQSDGSDHANNDELLAELDALIGREEEAGGEIDFVPTSIDFSDFGAPVEPGGYLVSFEPDFDLYRRGNSPGALIRALEKLGQAEVRLDTGNVAVLSEWSQADPSLRWDVRLSTDATENEVAAVFEFVEDCCNLSISRLAPAKDDALPDLAIESRDPVAEMAAAAELDGQPTEAQGQDDLAAPASPRPASPTDGLSPKLAEPAATATIRVSLDRVDKLMNMIGELVIKEAMLTQVVQTAGLATEPEVVGTLDGLRQLAADIQESVMAIRAQPLRQVFQRMHRILREAAEATGKQVRFAIVGEQTEVDKTMVERLIDPLTHMIRNSVDHGLEDAVTRQRNGKPLEGTITLSAAHKSGRVQIEVSDDGGGINRAKVRRIAEEKGLVAPGASLTPGEIDSLLFLPGFSSKDEVSALSGRGVGLDVVRREIMALGGRVMIQSVEGKGTTFTITLPLTLAVLEGMLIQLNDQTMVLPITSVQETLRPDQASLHHIGSSGRALASRGKLIPIIDLGCSFGLREQPGDLDNGVLIVAETDNHKRAAFQVDAIFDQRQVVIKSLEENYGRVPGVSAATILGDGKIALIIDPEEIIMSTTNETGRDRVTLVAAE